MTSSMDYPIMRACADFNFNNRMLHNDDVIDGLSDHAAHAQAVAC